MIRHSLAGTFLTAALAATSHANPCADVERARTTLEAGFAGLATRNDGRLEYLPFPLFGKDDCYIQRVWGASTQRRITCLFIARNGDVQQMDAFARSEFQRLAPALQACLTTHEPFDNRPNEDPDDKISVRLHFRSHNGRETWGLTVEPGGLPKAALSIDYETDAAEAQRRKPMPGFLQNVLGAQACETFSKMDTLARSNFAGVETKRAGGHSALAKPLDGAKDCFAGRNPFLDENVIACSWLRIGTSHEKWAADLQAIRLVGARSCRKGWSETKTAFGTAFLGPNGEKLALETKSGELGSVTSISLTILGASKPVPKTAPQTRLIRPLP